MWSTVICGTWCERPSRFRWKWWASSLRAEGCSRKSRPPGARNVAAENSDELTALVAEIRDRVRARYQGTDAGTPLPDLMPLVQARDAAEAKVASIGMV